MVEIIHRKELTTGIKHHKYFGNWHNSRGGFDQGANSNTDPKALREWANSKKDNPNFDAVAASAKHQADEAHKMGMKMRNKDLKEHEHPYWKQ